MAFKLFYSWQSKTDQKLNRYFIRDCIKTALDELEKEMKDNSPGFILEMDTTGEPGMPSIPATIHERIKGADIYIPDLTFIITPADSDNEGISASNVLLELGYALGENIQDARIISVMNTAYGAPNKLPFDIKQRRFPITYHLDANTSADDKKKIEKEFTGKLKGAIKSIFETELERQKQYNFPFENWKTWETTIERQFAFEETSYVKDLFIELRSNVNTAKTIYRFCGLSGIGKTRILFECFAHKAENVAEEVTNKILYVNLNEAREKDVQERIKEMVRKSESRILIVDNCSVDFHNQIVLLIRNEISKLSLITVGTDPEEKSSLFYPGGVTRLLILKNDNYKQVVTQILATNFNGKLEEDEQKLLVEFSSGVSFVATLMATNPDRGQYQPGTLTQENIVRRLLGPFYTDETSKAVVCACSLFSKLGFSDELAHQLEAIAMHSDIFEVDTGKINLNDVDDWKKTKFKEICKQLLERQLLEKRGRTYTFRPSPLAVRMAEEWWRNCTEKKFERILPVLKEANLVESFCEQFQFLKQVDNAKTIVKNLCDGFFSSAEVLNTAVGSRLFRSFVYVNPVACSEALYKAHINLPKETLEAMREGRRDLVWALEKLCFRPETFVESAKVLATFAVAENENIANNATGQFLQLYHIQLPGTAANLEARWQIIQFCLNGNEDFQSLGLRALSSALAVGYFSRTGGAEDQGDPEPLKDYPATGKEVYSYWQNVVSALDSFASAEGPFRERAVDIIKDKFFGLCVEGAGKLIIPVFSNLINSGKIERLDARRIVQTTVNAPRLFDKDAISALRKLLESLTPKDFEERFQTFVVRPSHNEYVDDSSEKTLGVGLSKKVAELALEFVQQPENWKELSDSFFTDHLAEGYNFGKSISEIISRPDIEKLTGIILDKLKTVPPEGKNISVLIGLLSSYADKSLAISVFNKILQDEELRHISFVIARSVELPEDNLTFLLETAKKGNIPVVLFNEFTYGRGLKHLPHDKAVQILQEIRKLNDDSKVVVFFILSTWIGNDEKLFEEFRTFLREIILEDSHNILSKVNSSMDVHYYSEIAVKLLTAKKDEELARVVIDVVVQDISTEIQFYSKQNAFYKILSSLKEKYFDIFWNAISKMYSTLEGYGIAAYHFKDLLGGHHDYYNQSEGLLFSGDSQKFDTIFEWCKQQTGREIYWIAELLPLYNPDHSSQSRWHPYALRFINEFGSDRHVLNCISAKLGTYSWVGSVVPMLEGHKALYEELADHPNQVVKQWAQAELREVERRIKWERDRDEDGII